MLRSISFGKEDWFNGWRRISIKNIFTLKLSNLRGGLTRGSSEQDKSKESEKNLKEVHIRQKILSKPIKLLLQKHTVGYLGITPP